VQDVLEIIAPYLLTKQPSLALGNNPTETKLIQLLQSGIRDGDQLQQVSGIAISEFSQTLSIMEINGVVRALGANQWALR
jgi:predicted Rossmann fold nucleotide-binding protein DprA/Smf involved in DNA uptake